jgi:ferredoxin
MPRLTFADESKTAECPAGRTILACAMDMNVRLSHVCGGDGACGTCRVEVVEGWSNLTAPTPDETYKEIDPPYRLGCQAKLTGDVVLKVARIE